MYAYCLFCLVHLLLLLEYNIDLPRTNCFDIRSWLVKFFYCLKFAIKTVFPFTWSQLLMLVSLLKLCNLRINFIFLRQLMQRYKHMSLGWLAIGKWWNWKFALVGELEQERISRIFFIPYKSVVVKRFIVH